MSIHKFLLLGFINLMLFTAIASDMEVLAATPEKVYRYCYIVQPKEWKARTLAIARQLNDENLRKL